jgi:hypothetical protein
MSGRVMGWAIAGPCRKGLTWCAVTRDCVKHHLHSLAALLALVATPVTADTPFQIINDTGVTLMEFYASPTGEGAWGEDLLHVKVLRSGESRAVAVVHGSSECRLDVLYVLEDGQRFFDIMNVCEMPGYIAQGR